MNLNHEQEPFTLSEFAAGSSAVAAVALIALLGARAAQPPNPPANVLAGTPPAAAAGAAADASQRRRHVPTATARARQGVPPNDATGHVAEPSPHDQVASNPSASNEVATNAAAGTAAAASNFLIEAAPTTVVQMQSPDIGGPPPPLFGPPDLFQTKDAMGIQPARPFKEEQPVRPIMEAALPPPEPVRNPSNRSDAIWIQTRLHDLGYFAGNGSGVWGPASRNALRDFKTMNGLAADDRWDRETEQRLLTKQNVAASNTFIGGWAQSAEECQEFRGAGAPLVIHSRGAETDGVKCSFKSVKRELATTWRAQAACSSGGQSWNSNVSMKLTGSSLAWSSETGNETYVRCVKP